MQLSFEAIFLILSAKSASSVAASVFLSYDLMRRRFDMISAVSSPPHSFSHSIVIIHLSFIFNPNKKGAALLPDCACCSTRMQQEALLFRKFLCILFYIIVAIISEIGGFVKSTISLFSKIFCIFCNPFVYPCDEVLHTSASAFCHSVLHVPNRFKVYVRNAAVCFKCKRKIHFGGKRGI